MTRGCSSTSYVSTKVAAVSPAKPPEIPDEEVDDPLYLMTLTIPQLFLKPLQVMWDATIFEVFNQNFPLYIKHEDLFEIAHDGQCLSISVIQLWILQVCERGILMCMDSSSHSPFRDLGNHNLNPKVTSRVRYRVQNEIRHWQMVVILPKENLVVWFCSLHNRSDNYLKGIINRQKGITECGYYVMRWMSTIILGSFRNNWETYFNEVRPLEAERFKALRIQWVHYYLKVRNQT
ncbi:hypothetical protein GmHk_02G004656 [Glycine max]|nr:hypothetical protein GmHk_02G004656 [Glycine max]